jgi:hypothetical protein
MVKEAEEEAEKKLADPNCFIGICCESGERDVEP